MLKHRNGSKGKVPKILSFNEWLPPKDMSFSIYLKPRVMANLKVYTIIHFLCSL